MRIATVVTAFAVAGVAALGVATPASAAEKDGNCDIGAGNGEFCVFDVNAQTADFVNPDANHGDDRFLLNGGIVLNSPLTCCVRNSDTVRTAVVYNQPNFVGDSVVLPPSTIFANPPPNGTASNNWQ